MFFVLPPSLEELRHRLERRGDTNHAEIERRLAIADAEIGQAEGLFDYLVVNDDLERCVDEVLTLLGD
jgi:guanylate kinase